MSIWWRDHGHPTLFSSAESLGLLRVMLDLNVFIDLESSYKRSEQLESGALAGDWLADQVDLVVSSELLAEIGRHPDAAEKDRQLQAARKYLTVRTDHQALEATARQITDLALKTSGTDLSADPSDVSDVRHLAAASLSGTTVIATRDEGFIDWSAKVTGTTGVRVMRPSDVVLQLDELSRAQEYRPAQLESTQYALTPVRPRSDADLLPFMHDNKGERKPGYLARIRRLLAEGPLWNRLILRDPRGDPIAFFVTGADDSQLLVPVLRVRTGRQEETVTRQLLFLLRKQACAAGKNAIRITDPALADTAMRAIREEGLVHDKDSWVGLHRASVRGSDNSRRPAHTRGGRRRSSGSVFAVRAVCRYRRRPRAHPVASQDHGLRTPDLPRAYQARMVSRVVRRSGNTHASSGYAGHQPRTRLLPKSTTQWHNGASATAVVFIRSRKAQRRGSRDRLLTSRRSHYLQAF